MPNNIQQIQQYLIGKGIASNAYSHAQLAKSLGVNLNEQQIESAAGGGTWETLDPLYGQLVSKLNERGQNVQQIAADTATKLAGPGNYMAEQQNKARETLTQGGYGVNVEDMLRQSQGKLPSGVEEAFRSGGIDQSEYERFKGQASPEVLNAYTQGRQELSSKPQFSYQDFIKQQTAKNMQLTPFGQTHTQGELLAGAVDTGSPMALQGTRQMPTSSYQGNSIVDYLSSVGQNSSFANRSALAKQYGIQNYTGTASQNLQLLGLLRSGQQGLSAPTGTSTADKLNAGISADKVGVGGTFTGVAPVNTNSAEVNGFVNGIDQMLAQTNAQFQAKIAELQAATPAEKEQSELYKRLQEAVGKTVGQGQATAEAELKATQELDKQIGDIKLQMAQVKAGIQAFANQAIPTPFIVGQQREQAVTLGNLSTVLLALQDNRAAALAQADRTVALQFADAENEIKNTQALLQANEAIMSKEEKKQATQLQLLLDERQKAIDQAKEERKNVLGIAMDAAKNGADTATVSAMSNAKTVEEALRLAGNSLRSSAGTEIVDLGNRKVLIDSKTGNTIKDLGAIGKVGGSSGGGGGGGGGGGVGTGKGGALTDLDILREAVSNKIGSVAAKNSFNAQYAKATTDEQRLKILAANVVLPTEIKNGLIQNTQVTAALDDVLGMLDKGVQTGLLKAGQSYIANKVGTGGDKQIEAIKSKLVASLQPYRNKVTGAAWGPQEEAEYQSLIGSVKFSPEDLKNKLNVFKQTLKQQSQQAILSGIDPLGAINQTSVLQENKSLQTQPIYDLTNAGGKPEPVTQKSFWTKTKNWLWGS